MTPPPRAVSLDLDNTLWDTPPVLVRAEAVLRRWLEAELPALAERYDPAALTALRLEVLAGEPTRAHDLSWIRTEALRRAARTTGYEQAHADRAFEVFLAARNDIEPYDEVRPALARLAGRLPLYAVTNGNACVRRVGLGEHFAGAIDPVRAGAAKPDPRIFAELVRIAGVPPATILHVGDDPEADVEGARLAGLVSIWMNRTGARWAAPFPAPDHEVADLDELAALVEDMLGSR
jgi:FMN hydrolase / 5-amino-6-(5-phospho-D-ribitylamino)uracil phosphatase